MALTQLSHCCHISQLIAQVVQHLGRGSLLAKMDIESLHTDSTVHPQDRILQAVEREAKIYVDPMLPFGLRSAPKNINTVADALNWGLQQAEIRFIQHYLDDLAPLHSDECQQAVQTLDKVCARFGVPMVPHKRDGPTTRLIFLGIQIDTVSGELCLPEEKLQRLRTLLQEWGSRKTCQRQQLESLIGLLSQ